MKYHKSPPKEFWYEGCLTETFKYEYEENEITLPPMTPIMWFICVLH